jgi:hypothetical protein
MLLISTREGTTAYNYPSLTGYSPSFSPPSLTTITYQPSTIAVVANEVLPITNAMVGDTVTVTIPSGSYGTVNAVSTAFVGNNAYTLAPNPVAPQPGQYTYNPTTQALTLYVQPGQNLQGLSVSYTGSYDSLDFIYTDEVQYALPPILQGLTVEGEITISRSFEQEPTASFKLVALASDEATLKNLLRPRTEITLGGIGFAIAQPPQISELPRSQYPEGLIRVSVSLVSKWKWALQEPIRVQQSRPIINGMTCQQKQRPFFLSAKTIAFRLGIALRNIDAAIRYEGGTGFDVTTTLSEALQPGYTRLEEKFVYYSASDAIEGRRFGNTQVHTIVDAEIIGGIEKSFGSDDGSMDDPLEYQGVWLKDVYRNRQLSLQNWSNGSENEEGERIAVVTSYEPPFDPAIVPEELQNLNSVTARLDKSSYSWDNGGPTRSQKIVTRAGQYTLSEREIKYGLVFCMLDTHVVEFDNDPDVQEWKAKYSGGDAVDFWMLIEDSVTTWNYDGEGYLTSTDRVGVERRRVRSEGGTETLDIEVDIKKIQEDLGSLTPGTAEHSELTGQVNTLVSLRNQMYIETRFVPIRAITVYNLAAFKDFYPVSDSTDPCDGVNRFCIQEQNATVSIVQEPNPISKDADAMKARQTYESIEKYFKPTDPTYLNGKITIGSKDVIVHTAGNLPEMEGYTNITRTHNQEGSELAEGLKIAPYEYQGGRPGSHTRMKGQMGGLPMVLAQYSYDLTWLLNTEDNDYPPLGVSRGSVSYNTNQPMKGRLAAEVDSAITNSRESYSCQIEIFYRPELAEGDMVLWRGAYWIIFQNDTTFSLSPGLIKGRQKLTLGLYLRPDLDLIGLKGGISPFKLTPFGQVPIFGQQSPFGFF